MADPEGGKGGGWERLRLATGEEAREEQRGRSLFNAQRATDYAGSLPANREQ
jgi:hypothetical protein